MSFLKKIMSGGPRYMRQDLFNSVLISAYCAYRWNFNSFDAYVNEFKKGGDILEIFRTYLSRYSNDDFLEKDFLNGVAALEDFLVLTFGSINYESQSMMEKIRNFSDKYDTNGYDLKQSMHIMADSHPNPRRRLAQLREDLTKYKMYC